MGPEVHIWNLYDTTILKQNLCAFKPFLSTIFHIPVSSSYKLSPLKGKPVTDLTMTLFLEKVILSKVSYSSKLYYHRTYQQIYN